MGSWPPTIGEIVSVLVAGSGLLGLGHGLRTGGLKRWVSGWVTTIVGIVRANFRLEECRQDKYERSVNVIRDHDDSVRAIGRYMVSRRYDRVLKGGTLVRKVWNDLKKNAWPAEVMELTTVNAGKSWERYGVGDSVGVSLPTANVIKQCRILARSVDVDTQTETLGVEVEHESDGWS